MDEDPRDGTAPGLWGRIACAWALAFALLHFFWALGGSWGLSVSAGPLAEERPLWLVVTGLWGAGLLCLAGAGLGRLLAGPQLPDGAAGRALRALGWAAGGVLLTRGVVVEVLLLTDPSGRTVDVSPEQRMWTLLLWNPWFLVGGLAFGLPSLRAGRVADRRGRTD